MIRMAVYPLLVLLGSMVVISCSSSSPNADRPAIQAQLDGRNLTDSTYLPLLDSATLGDPNAPIVIVEFVGLPCPDCARGAASVDALYEQNPDKVQIVFKHRPNDNQQESWMAARMLEAAHRQDSFFEMRALLLEKNDELRGHNIREMAMEMADELGLNTRQFRADLESLDLLGRIERDQRLADELELRINPTYFVNGKEMVGPRRLRDLQETVAQIERMTREMRELDVPDVEHYASAVSAFRAQRQEERHSRDVDLDVQDVDTTSAFVEIDEHDFVYGETEEFLVTVVEFSSLQCPFSADASETIAELEERYAEEVRFVFKHFPMDMHIHSVEAARALFAADRQQAGLPMMRRLFRSQNRFGEDGYFQQVATELELDQAQFQRDFSAGATEDFIWESRESGEALGVVGTPHFFINGVPVSGAMSVDHFARIIDRELIRARSLKEELEIEGDELYRALIEDLDGTE